MQAYLSGDFRIEIDERTLVWLGGKAEYVSMRS